MKNPGISAAHWREIIRPQTSLFDLKLNEVWRYRDLVWMFVRRDFVANYKQTILGPIWFFLQPLLTTITYMLIFGRMAGLSTGGVPALVFYLAGVTLWNYYSETLNKTATVFKDNAQIFGKVYFPRLTMPLSIVISNMVKLGIQLALFIAVWLFYVFFKGGINPNMYALLSPFLIVVMGILALGGGMIISSMTTKYKDLIFLLTFGIQLMMFVTPVIYPLESIDADKRWIILANPMTSIVETFRFGFLGQGVFSWWHILYSTVFAIVLLVIGTVVFNKVEKGFMDTV